MARLRQILHLPLAFLTWTLLLGPGYGATLWGGIALFLKLRTIPFDTPYTHGLALLITIAGILFLLLLWTAIICLTPMLPEFTSSLFRRGLKTRDLEDMRPMIESFLTCVVHSFKKPSDQDVTFRLVFSRDWPSLPIKIDPEILLQATRREGADDSILYMLTHEDQERLAARIRSRIAGRHLMAFSPSRNDFEFTFRPPRTLSAHERMTLAETWPEMINGLAA